ncbi:MAG: B12-binding domain-containing radical SAM protein [Polyangiales bacterium]
MPKIALVGPEIEENLSLRYLASSLSRAGYEVELIPFNVEQDFASALSAVMEAEERPMLVGISLAFQWRARDFLAYAVALREVGYRGHVTAGGHFATFASEDLLREFPEIDSVCRQEAEETIVKLAEAVRTGSEIAEISGLALRDAQGVPYRTPSAALPDLAALPGPDRRGPPAACFGHGIAPLVGSRGCYANCSFCCIAAWHEQSLPGKRYRLRDVDAIAEEMVEQKKTRGVDIFVFHDDNFFLPGHKKNRERISALADALEKRGIGEFATVVKARPTDVDPEVFRLLVHRLNCIRVYIGIETDADQGLETLRRWSHVKQNQKSIEIVRGLDLYTCFNLLIFDPDTRLEDLRTNVRFLRWAKEFPSNFGRVELYAGTPLLDRMLKENRCTGDFMQWDYELASPDVERVFRLAMRMFHARNFGEEALANRIMATRFDLEVVRHFHPEIFRAEWHAEGKELSSMLAVDGADALDRILDHVEAGAPAHEDARLIAELEPQLRATERTIAARARELARTLQRSVGRGAPLTDLGDRVATSLQTARHESGVLQAEVSA